MGRALMAFQDRGSAQLMDVPQESHIPNQRLKEMAAHILHGIPTGAMYEEVTEICENHDNDHRLEAAFHSQLK
jgi:hypothetical protein